MLIKKPRGWEIPESAVTPKSAYVNRRQVLRRLGLGGLALTAGGCFFSIDDPGESSLAGDDSTYLDEHRDLYPAPQNMRFMVAERETTDRDTALTYNNFYEFTTSKQGVHELVDRFVTNPWTIEVTGLVQRPQTFDFDDLVRMMPLEERIYRLRCVEAWSAVIPWTGFPVSALLTLVEPMASARFVRMVSESRPSEMPGVDANAGWPWPYHEGLTLEEATNELAFFVTGAYGEVLRRQNGAPIRLAVPWKYGYKSIKSIIRIELTDEQPPTFWSTLVPAEYTFQSNVDPNVPHPRWSQATELDIGTGERIPTQVYNGYGDFVAQLYT